MANRNRAEVRTAVHKRIRHKVRGTTARPRLAVYRSLNHIYAQLIDDEKAQTLAAASTTETENHRTGTRSEGPGYFDQSSDQGSEGRKESFLRRARDRRRRIGPRRLWHRQGARSSAGDQERC